MFGSRSVMSDVPQWSVLELTVSNMFISIIKSGITLALSKFAGGTTLSNTVNRFEGQYVIQRVLDNLKPWAL